MTVTQTTPPAYQPLTLTEVKLHLRVDHSDEDALIGILQDAAVDTCQQLTGRSIMAQGWKLTLNGWVEVVRLHPRSRRFRASNTSMKTGSSRR